MPPMPKVVDLVSRRNNGSTQHDIQSEVACTSHPDEGTPDPRIFSVKFPGRFISPISLKHCFTGLFLLVPDDGFKFSLIERHICINTCQAFFADKIKPFLDTIAKGHQTSSTGYSCFPKEFTLLTLSGGETSERSLANAY